jgi:glucose-1-phosphate cytidylyltransferase
MIEKIKTCVILAGGLGSRITEETVNKPKPMVNIGNLPIIHHIMNHYSKYGVYHFIICVGYKSQIIKEYFANLLNFSSNIEIDFPNNKLNILQYKREEFKKWKVKIIETGEKSNTGGRIKIVEKWIPEENFFLTYGDGLSDVNLEKLTKSHFSQKNNLVTLTAVKKNNRFGNLVINKNQLVTNFIEKNKENQEMINGGFQVVNKKALKFIKSSTSSWESDVLELLANKRKLMSYKHNGFWQCMDNLREKQLLERLWESKKAPWL